MRRNRVGKLHTPVAPNPEGNPEPQVLAAPGPAVKVLHVSLRHFYANEFLSYVISSPLGSLYLCFPASRSSAALIISSAFELVDAAWDCFQTAESTADVRNGVSRRSTLMMLAASMRALQLAPV